MVATNKHDLLGLFNESLWYLGLHVVALGGLFGIDAMTEDDRDKRVISWLGGALLFFATNFICSYIVFIRFKLLRPTLLSLCM